MKSILTKLSILFVFVFYSQGNAQANLPFNPDDKIPVDGKIIVGKLPNGLTYYIRENHKPEKRAELRLAVKVGSVHEDDDQLGLAHFVEHMAFNGTKNFKKQALVNYLESIGMKFGPEVNAYTSFDRTVYMLQIPTDSMHLLKKGFQILEDWAHNVSYDNDEIDKERGVIIEEWRLGRGANDRMFNKQLPILFKNSKYADRYVIGKKEILESFSYETIKRFYKDWYRPDLMAVSVVGDFDKKQIEEMIIEHFSRLTMPEKPREYLKFPVPGHKETLFAIASDKEAPYSSISIYNKFQAKPELYVKDMRATMVERLFSQMLSQRLFELTQKSNSQFAYGGAYKGRFIGEAEVFYLQAFGIKENKIAECLDILLTEYERVKKFGFTSTELERAKASTLRGYEKSATEKDKTESRMYADEYLRNFLQDEFIPGIEYEYEVHKKYLPTITMDEVNKLVQVLMTGESRVLTVNMPEKEGLHIPTESELKAVIDAVDKKEIIAYQDKTSNQPLVEQEPKPGSIVNEKVIKEIDVTEWQLANGVRVILKPTDFKNDEIALYASSPGGTSLTSNEEFPLVSSASSIIGMSGVGNYDNIMLQKYLTGKIVRVSPWIGETNEGFYGNCSPKDFETMLQLIYLYFNKPRKDSTGYLAFKTQMQAMLENQKESPEKAFQDSLTIVLNKNHVRRQPPTIESMKLINLEKSYKFYCDRFADASDFTFYFVGNFKKDEIKPMIEKYLGSLSSPKRNEIWKDVGVEFAQGIEKKVSKGIEPKSYVQIVFSGPFVWSPENRWELESVRDVINIKLREVIREDKGGTYGVSVFTNPMHYPKERYTFGIWFGCNPERVEELTKTIYEQLDSLKNFGPKETYISKVKEIQKRTNETNMKENRYWLNSLSQYYTNNEDPLLILQKDKMAEKLNHAIIQKRAKETFGDKNFIRVVLYPEKK